MIKKSLSLFYDLLHDIVLIAPQTVEQNDD